MFRIEKDRKELALKDSVNFVKNIQPPDYLIRKGDKVRITVLNSDYNYLAKGMGQGANSNASQGGASSSQNTQGGADLNVFLVESDGTMKVPLVGIVKLEGLTLRQASNELETQYALYYKNIFIRIEVLNRRVFVLGATRQSVYNLENESTTLLELLSDIGGISENAKSQNVKIIRGDLQNPEIIVVDLSTLEGLQKTNLTLHDNDVIYVEPVKKITIEAIAELQPFISILTTLLLVWGLILKN